ncbi:MAG: hypothetical protein JWM27_3540 [Gemmatimonadetes bacterium]|nr:hypothetical protein [Gemmatimonadota bacterium]
MSAAGVAAGVLPRHVREAEVAGALGRELAARGIAVAAAPLPELDKAMDAALDHLVGDPVRARLALPDTWAETGCTPEELRAFHEAAAAFYAAAPWKVYADAEPLLVGLSGGASWAASVMGGGGMEFGMALYSHPDDLVDLLESAAPDPVHMVTGMRGFTLTVTFDPKAELERSMQREVAKAGWRVASANAYPRLYGIKLPERRVTDAHVRVATRALGAVTLAAAGVDPESLGVRVSVMDAPEGDDECEPMEPPRPVLAEGPGADPLAALRDAEAGSDDLEEMEQARFQRLQGWLMEQGLPKSVLATAVRNANDWGTFCVYHAIPAGAVTEYDLRLFLYRFFPLAVESTKAATRDLPRSMELVLRFLEAEEGIRYPFGDAVLAELREHADQAKVDGTTLDKVLSGLAESFWDDQDSRGLLPAPELRDVPGGWAAGMKVLPGLRRELHRRWLLWYDEEVRNGATDYEALYVALVQRQRAWENAPHPDYGGRTPVQVIRETLERGEGAGEKVVVEVEG